MEAQVWCMTCPVFWECHAKQEEIQPDFGVWAAVFYNGDRTPDDE